MSEKMENGKNEDEPVLLIEKDNEWIEGTYYVISEESQNGSILQFVNGKVSFDGQHKAPGTKFKVYKGVPDDKFDRYLMFECQDGDSKGHMLCFNKQRLISCREKNKDFIVIKDATSDTKEHDVIFKQVVFNQQSSRFLLQTYSDSKCFVGCSPNGKMLDPSIVNAAKSEAEFMLIPYS